MKTFLILISVLLLSCDFTENRFVTVKNNSEKNITCFISKVDIHDIIDISEMNSATHINTKEFAFLVPTTRGNWEGYIEKCDAKKARIYIITKDSIDKYGWKNIYKKNIYNKKYLFTIEELEEINWEIGYDGK